MRETTAVTPSAAARHRRQPGPPPRPRHSPRRLPFRRRGQAHAPPGVPPRRGRGGGCRHWRGGPLRRPDARAAAPRGGPRSGGPLPPRRGDREGRDRLTWLHSITSQHLTGLGPHESRESLVLSPKGHIEHVLHLVDDGETAWITTEPATPRRWRRGWTRCASCCGSRSPTSAPTGRWSASPQGPSRSRRAAGLARPVAGPRRRHGGVRACGRAPGQRPGMARGARPARGARGSDRRPCPARAPGPARPCASLRGGPASASRPTTAPSRTRSTGCVPPSTSTRAATGARRRSRGPQPRPSAAAARLPAPRRVGAHHP